MSDLHVSLGEDDSLEALLGHVAGEFTGRLQRGEKPDVEEYSQRYPQLAKLLHEILPALQIMGPGDAAATADEAPLALDRRLGDFRIVRQVGQGGMGVVYEAEQISLGRRVALKVLPLVAALDSRRLVRFQNEARAAACLHHGNIVPIFGVGCDRGVHFYAMQFIDGRTLAALIGQLRGAPHEIASAGIARPAGDERDPHGPGTLSQRLEDGIPASTFRPADHWTRESTSGTAYFRRVAELGVQAAEALDYAHQMGIVHRDVKPANLMLDARGVLWVTDFGLAMLQAEAGPTLTGDLVGTLRYMSPEQALARRVPLDHRTDVYALGATLYELLTLQPVFTGNDRQELLRQIAGEEPVRPRRLKPAIPGELETIVCKALEKRPQDRYASAQELADELRRFLEDRPILARRPSWLQVARKWSRRHQAVVWSAAVTLLVSLVVVAGSIGWVLRDQAVRRADRAQGVRGSLAEAHDLFAQNKLAPARQKLAEARGRIGEDRAALAALAIELDSFEAALDRFQQFQALVERAHDAEFRGTKWEFAGAVPSLLKALACYQVLGPEDWAASLEHGVLAKEQADTVRRTVYAELLRLAQDLLYRHVDHQSGQPIPVDMGARQALAYLQQAEMSHQHTSTFYKLRARAHAALGETAAQQADQEMALKTPVAIGLDYFLEGCLAFSVRDRAEGIKAFEAALRVEPTDYWSMMLLGYCLCDLGKGSEDFRAASMAFTGCILKRPEHAHAYFSRGNAYHKLGRLADALADYSTAIALNPNDRGMWNNRGAVYKDLRQWDQALADFSRAIELDPKDASAWHNRCVVYTKLGRWDQALVNSSRVVELRPDSARAWNTRGLAYQMLGQWQQALADYARAIELDPNDPLGWFNRGIVYHHLKEWDAALRDTTRAIELDPKDATAWYNRGLVYADLKQWDKTLADEARSIALDPTNALAWHSRGTAYINLDQAEKALVDFSKTIELSPAYALAWSNRGFTYIRLKQWDKAGADYSQAIKLEPKVALPYRMLAWLLSNCPDIELREPGRAVELAKKGVELAPQVGLYWLALGMAHYRAGDWRAALAALEKGMSLRRGGDSLDWLFVALCHGQLDHRDEARQWYDRAARAMDQAQTKNEDLRRVRAEAEELLIKQP